MKKNIVLIGFMGVGKTSLGKSLANKLGVEFFDTDQIIEENEACEINEIFAKQGENYFRDLEGKLIDQFLGGDYTDKPFVLSVGGGLPVYNNLMEKLKQCGVCIYLQRPAKELFHRLVNAKSKRPLIEQLSEEELLSYIVSKLEEREVYYKEAHLEISREKQSVNNIIEEVKLYLNQ